MGNLASGVWFMNRTPSGLRHSHILSRRAGLSLGSKCSHTADRRTKSNSLRLFGELVRCRGKQQVDVLQPVVLHPQTGNPQELVIEFNTQNAAAWERAGDDHR